MRLSGWNAKRVIFGALNPRTGHRVLLARPHPRREDFGQFLQLLRTRYGARPLMLLLDEASCHIAQYTHSLARRLAITLVYLPKRSPELSPMDHLWREPKAKVCANHQYADIDEEVRAFIAYILDLSPRQALRKAGTLSRHFWLRGALSKSLCGPT